MPESRRLAFVVTELDPGGAERALVRIATGLSELGWSPKVFCLSGPGELVRPLEEAGIPVDSLGAQSRWSWGVVRRLTQGLTEWRPAVVQTFLFHANLAGRLAARRAGCPVVISGLRVAERDAPWRMRLDRWTQRWVTMNVAVSRGVSDFVVREQRFAAEKVRVIPNGVDAERFAAASPADLSVFGVPSDARVITFIGRMHSQKGPDLLLEATLPLLQADPRLHLLLVGDGPLRSGLEGSVREHPTRAQVHFVGTISDTAGILPASTALVVPSRWEGMPNVVLEGMAAGCPVVATPVEGVNELIASGSTGILCERVDVPSIRRGIGEVLADASRAAAMADTAQHLVKKQFTWTSVVRMYDDLYRELTVQ
jgi:glycosyltransferase involved in cell wall biosynthesis